MGNFEIYGDQKALTQWDVGRKVAAAQKCDYIHFANAAMSEAVACKAREEDGVWIADIPDEVLQVAGVLRVYAFVVTAGENYTKHAQNLFVRARPKPTDYLYTPTTGVSWEEMVNRVKALEEKTAQKPVYTAEEVGARADTWMPTADDVGARPDTWLPNIADIGAAPAGFGFGDRMTYVDMTSDTYSGMTFEEALETVLATMPGYSCAQVQFYDPDNGYHTNKFVGKLWKYTPNYVTLEAINYSGYKAILRKQGGTWQDWAWENPPMLAGVEYRMAERHNGKVVYTMLVELGALPNATSKTVAHKIVETATFISFEVFAKNSNSTLVQQFPIVSISGALNGKAQVSGSGVIIYAFADLSMYIGHAVVRYTKD